MGLRGAGAGEEYCVSTKDTKVHSAAGEGGRGDYTVYADREAETTGEEGGYGRTWSEPTGTLEVSGEKGDTGGGAADGGEEMEANRRRRWHRRGGGAP